MGRITETLRSGDWLTGERMRLAATAVLIASLAGLAFLIATSDGRNDQWGRPLGTDFSNVYAAGSLVLEGHATAPFDVAQQYAREQAIFGANTPYYGWHYPPFFLLVAAALALMPYAVALALWQAVTFGLYLLALRPILAASQRYPGPEDWPLWLLLIAFPAVFINLGHGHNGFLTAALLAGALALRDRPAWSGILFGLLAYKPQFGILIPLALAAGGYWRTIAAAAATVLVLVALTTLAFGVDVWSAFLASTKFTRTVVLEQGATGWQKMQTVFSWVRMWGGSVPLAYALQGAATVAISAGLAWLWRSPADFRFKAAALCLATPLATPYSLDYDMMALAPAIAFLTVGARAEGFAPWEKTALAALWLVPLLARSVAQTTLIPLGALTMVACFILVLHRSVQARDHYSLAWNSAPPSR